MDPATRFPDPKTPEEFSLRGFDYFIKGEREGSRECVERAVNDLQTALDGGYATGDVYSIKGQAEFHLGWYQEALADFKKAISLGARYLESRVALCLLRTGDATGALEECNRAVEKSTLSPGTYEARAEIHLIAGRERPALSDLEMALLLKELGQVDESDSRARARQLVAHCQAYLSCGDVKKAQAAVESAIGLDPLSIEAQLYRARVYRKQKIEVEAEAAIKRALAITPTDANGHYHRALVHQLAGNTLDILPELGKAIAGSEQQGRKGSRMNYLPQAYELRALWLESMGDPEPADADLSAALDRHLLMAQQSLGSNQPSPMVAAMHLTRVLLIKPGFGKAHYLRGKAFNILHRHELAAMELKRANELAHPARSYESCSLHV